MIEPLEIWIDALDFSEKGGWKEDTQFVHLMGSGYLLAADEPGVPVKDACVTVNIPEAGRYRAWVRDRNWLRPHDPGKFSLLVNSQDNGIVLGAMPSDAWVWEIAGDFELEEGPCTIALHDLTGYFGRCASILLTTDLDYTPPREVERIHKERARIKGLPMAVQEGGDYDVIVAGGGPAGVPAAIACAREGVKTLLIQDRPMLGGNGSIELGIPFDGAEVSHPRAREGGIAEEIRRLRDRDPNRAGDWTRAMEQLAAAEKDLTVVFDQRVIGADMAQEDVIGGVTALDIHTLIKTHYSGRIFIDCTGDAWLGYFAGAKYRYGRESMAQHGEDMAPEIPDTLTMSGCIRSGCLPFFSEAQEEVPYHAPSWVPKLPESDEEFGRVINDKARMYWWLEAPNTYDDMWDGEVTRDALFLVILGYLDHLKNYWSGRETVKNSRFRFASILNGRRESRRLVGDYVLTQDDCTSGRRFEDAVSYSGWALDIHHPQGIYSGAAGPLYSGKHVNLPHIPYRCLYSVNIGNLLMTGRNVSVTHIALGTVRVQNTIATLGQAAGTAAAMCVKLGETPRGLYERHMKALQQLLVKNDQYIPGVQNEDPGDPCLHAEAEASSVNRKEIFRPIHGSIGPWIPMDQDRATIGGFSAARGDVTKIWLRLRSDLDRPVTVKVHVKPLGDLDTSAQNGIVAEGQAEVPPKYEGWVCFPVFVPVDPAGYRTGAYLLVWMDRALGISWRSIENLSNYRRVGVRREDGSWEMTAGFNLDFTLKEPHDTFADCSAGMAVNGYSRILSAEQYEWVSDPDEALPQWLCVHFCEPSRINAVSLVFDTDMTNPGNSSLYKYPEVRTCVRDYRVEISNGSKWSVVAEEKDNFMRKRTHRFPTVTAKKIRVTVLATWGDPSARITEVRAALEEEKEHE